MAELAPHPGAGGRVPVEQSQRLAPDALVDRVRHGQEVERLVEDEHPGRAYACLPGRRHGDGLLARVGRGDRVAPWHAQGEVLPEKVDPVEDTDLGQQ